MTIIEKMQALINEINRHNYNYYVLDNPTISDKEYDDLYYALVDMERESGIILDDSPTKKVGDTILKGFKKHKHEKKLYSLDKRNDYALWCLVLKKIKVGYKYGEILSIYRKSDNSISSGKKVKLLKYHYQLHRKVNMINIVGSAFLTIFNIVKYIFVKC